MPHSCEWEGSTSCRRTLIFPLRDRAVRLAREHRTECPSLTLTAASASAAGAGARQIGVGHKSARRLVRQADIDDGSRDGVTSVDHPGIERLRSENTRLREDVVSR
jgi:hypothetical protein